LDSPLVADIDGDGKNEVIHVYQGQVTLSRYDPKTGFTKFAEYASTAPPAIADLDGDGKLELIIGTASPTTDPMIQALRPGRTPNTLWKITLTPKAHTGLPHGRPLLFQTGRFLGRNGFDLYVYVGTPFVRSLVLK